MEALQVPKVACYEENLTDAEDLLDDYKNAKNEDGKYRHLDIIQEYLNSWKGEIETKDSVQTIIRGTLTGRPNKMPNLSIWSRVMKNKTDECFCEICGHNEATGCIKLNCKCCLEADKTRLKHPVFDSREGLTDEEKTRREEVAQGEEYVQRKSSAIGDDSLYSLP